MKGGTSTAFSTALIPFLGPWWAALFHSGANRPMDRALGAAATLGLSIAILRLVKRAFRAAKRPGEESVEPSIYPLIKGILRSLLMMNEQEDSNDTNLIKHIGSCHCRSIEFELMAPRTPKTRDSSGKIRYPRVRSEASNFRFTKGAELAHMYYVPSHNGDGSVVSAHSFCSTCGVHILHAPRSDADELEININCLDEQNEPVRDSRDDSSFANGVRVDRQWGTSFLTRGGVEQIDAKRLSIFGSFGDESSAFSQPSVRTTTTPDHFTKLHESAADRPVVSPGTPSTVNTSMCTDSFSTAGRLRSLAFEQDSSLESESISGESIGATTFGATASSNLPPRLNTKLPVTLESSASTATPKMRDQLKYYMKKHLKSSSSLSSTPNE